jgi:hypothetical protein
VDLSEAVSVRDMRRILARLLRRGLLISWLVSLAIVIVLILTHGYWLALIVAGVAVVGTIFQLRKESPGDLALSWDTANKISHTRPPRFEQVDREHPLIALAVGDSGPKGVYVNVIPAAREIDWIYQVGPTAWSPLPLDREDRAGDAVNLETWVHSLRYLPQGQFADEIWRRNFDSLRRGRIFRALPGKNPHGNRTRASGSRK